ncbi:ATP-binding protein [Pseudanabaena mucicola]|uniref:histidine kinase n=1 Tax=Pseudanabaena mucicola FACHB-723 TaxID=2692860 RepID=A0ABR7ZVS5_9CYAN|nr:ATP-binding protein [Pseudanabaena mucicola]MBD2187498.1 response regulator [Pseudanabaena mucicola FACHB-723]
MINLSNLEQKSLLTAIANRIQASLDLQVILDTTVQEIRDFLHTDRVIAYQFAADWSGRIVSEAVGQEWESLLGQVLTDPHFGEAMVEPYINGRIQVTDDIHVGLTNCHTKFLEQIQVKAIIVVPIVQGGELWGLLAAQECTQTRHWQTSEAELLQELATHISIAIRQSMTMTQLQQFNQELESKVLERTEALLTAKNQLNMLVFNVSDGILIIDEDGYIVFANPSAAKIFGIGIEQFIGILFGVPNDLNNRFEINHLINFEEVGGSEMQVVEIEWNQQPAYLISLHDVTERLQMEEKLRESNQELMQATLLKNEFLANMSHELRTPLNAILGMNEGLQDGVFGAINEKQLKALQTVEKSANHLLSMINDILDVAKIESGQVTLDLALTSIEELCHSSLVFIKQQSYQKHLQLEIKVAPNLPKLLIDERRMRQVLINLLSNAVKFTPTGGRITLEASKLVREDGLKADLVMTVTDTGIGISPENIKKLFRPFIQIDSALNRQYAGTGLGLALTKNIVELHGGRVGVTSKLGGGSCFTIEIPYDLESSSPVMSGDKSRSFKQEVDVEIEASTSQMPLLLIAEDNDANALTFSSYLEVKGYRTLFAKNGKEAIAIAKDKHPDLILMDIQMPVMDGLEAIRQIRLDPDVAGIPIIALTALAMKGDRERCLGTGANDYLSKPVRLKELAAMIQGLLQRN